jgi:argininosuccinate lyase
LWAGRLPGGLDPKARAFSASLNLDWRLAPYDIRGSLAHVAMLAHQGIVAPDEADAMRRGLEELLAEVEAGAAPWDPDAEDVHSAVEAELTRRIGAVAGKLHTGRSRNDQVALDLHLYLDDAYTRTIAAVEALSQVLVDQASRHQNQPLPGYTHLQRAQPVTVAHHLLAYVAMLHRDRERLSQGQRLNRQSPLGAGALAGSTLPLDPTVSAAALGWDAVYENSLDAVSDRDSAVDYVATAGLIAVHLSRLAADVVLWSTREFGFVELDDRWATGSSMMPQKKNPDVAELVRGRAARVAAALTGLLSLLKGLPLGYQRDLQEDKVYLFDAVDTTLGSLEAMAGLMAGVRFRPDRIAQALSQDLLATDEAEDLVRRGVPFRAAHAQVAARYAAGDPPAAPPEAIHESLRRRDATPMGPGPESVARQLKAFQPSEEERDRSG